MTRKPWRNPATCPHEPSYWEHVTDDPDYPEGYWVCTACGMDDREKNDG